MGVNYRVIKQRVLGSVTSATTNGEIRNRERCMRTLEKSDTPILSGMQIFHNHIRPHQALKGKTPAEMAGSGGQTAT